MGFFPLISVCGGILSLLELMEMVLLVKCLLCWSWGVMEGPQHLCERVGTNIGAVISILSRQREQDAKARLANWSTLILELQVPWETYYKVDR